jgi:L-threonylcarbamoyladenylate synthase
LSDPPVVVRRNFSLSTYNINISSCCDNVLFFAFKLRPGGITVERIRSFPGFENVKVFKRDFVDESMEQAPVTPGMKYKHYSPRMAVILFEVTPAPAVATTPAPAINCDTPTLLDRITSHVVVALRNGARQEPSNQVVGILRTSRTRLPLASHGVAPEQIIEHFVGDATAPASVAQGLFHGLRSLEAHNVSCILVEGVSEQEEGLAVMNRLRKAATHIL